MEATEQALRDLPSVDSLLGSPALEGLVGKYGRTQVVEAVRTALNEARVHICAGREYPPIVEVVQDQIEQLLKPSFCRVINATGVVIHTNLGRAPLSDTALERLNAVATSYTNLEFDLCEGVRGSRQNHVSQHLCAITTAEAALVVNNNAAALLLTMAALAESREVIVSRGELVEVGDGFRIPDVLASSGARLVEVGSTNRTQAKDYAEAVNERTGALLRVHPSNFRILGFTERPKLEELVHLASETGVPLVDDLGSGSFIRLPDEPTVQESIGSGVDIVAFSGDKLLGGPQAGIICGREDLIEKLRRHPLHRALRADKLTLAALEGTLSLYRMPERARKEIPVVRMLMEPLQDVYERASWLATETGGLVEKTLSRVGGGALPLADLDSFACAFDESLAEPLRLADPPIIGIIREGKLLLDCRTISDADLPEVAAVISSFQA